ncbi:MULTISPECIES: tetratricopeptide repeat protein [unclassified Luteimonas]|uniref:tetratricopeptide repeat protein n=1 Tax=unclassified Luteimonas TaxID=2629088 RepID=UPI0018F085D6|nr:MULTISPECIES: tetratricopeptide repeat protein [unclassified Luteimonas]MBJ6979807.1 tetratricopeptide repeat protein [Luteimonas sp. MC1895]MBJ6985501.1 tetratricopeptide repeat protein [Luteimonas sp. MC1750]QQO06013.1 tetratricopeptide repeat protein [Luteimonas sp. MC1750]
MHDQILDALRRGDTAAAVDAARRLAGSAPDDAQAQRLLALALRSSGDDTGARAAIERAMVLAPDDAALHLEHAGLLLGQRDVEGAARSLDATIGNNPNAFGAYIVQAQLAMGRNDLDEAERLARLAARVSPDDPALQGVTGTLALRRGRVDEALALLSDSVKRAPDDVVALHALGIAHMTKGHFAFAEQAFRSLLEHAPAAGMVRLLIAELLQRQGRTAEAADELATLVSDPALATAELRRHAGELQLAAGRPERGLELLRAALAADPRDGRTLSAIMAAWARLGAIDDARRTLDAALATTPDSDDLWRARLMFEWRDTRVSSGLVERWRSIMPDSLEALDAALALRIREGRQDEADSVARALLERAPGHMRAELQLADSLLERDPAEAARRLDALLARADTPGDHALLGQRLGVAHHHAGDRKAALACWERLNARQASERVPLPTLSPARDAWPEQAAADPAASQVVFLAGLPGSPVERVADLLAGAVPAFRPDRFGARPPSDALQNIATPVAIAKGAVAPAAVAASWRGALPARGVDGAVIDWLLWWDNAYAAVLREALPEARLLAVIRDPRDMLLNWLAFGSSTPFALASPQVAAEWLAGALAQLADLHEQDLVPHHLLRLDEVSEDPVAIVARLRDALGLELSEPPPGYFGAARFPAGGWRDYAGLLAGPFATLAPVARRLGYPDA